MKFPILWGQYNTLKTFLNPTFLDPKMSNSLLQSFYNLAGKLRPNHKKASVLTYQLPENPSQKLG
jgi:hypothetical protein